MSSLPHRLFPWPLTRNVMLVANVITCMRMMRVYLGEPSYTVCTRMKTFNMTVLINQTFVTSVEEADQLSYIYKNGG